MTTTRAGAVAIGVALVALIGIGFVGVVLSPLLAAGAILVGTPLLLGAWPPFVVPPASSTGYCGTNWTITTAERRSE